MRKIEKLTESQFDKLDGAHHRLMASQRYMEFVHARIAEAIKLQPGDMIGNDGTVFRKGRDDAAIADLRKQGIVQKVG